MSALYSSTNQNSLEKSPVSKTARFRQDLHSPKHNHLLAALPANDYVRLLPHMELVNMKVGDVLQEAGVPIEWIYFPTTSVVCLGYITENGSSPAVGLTGSEGFVGIACVMGSDSASTRAVVQNDGVGYRIRASLLKKELQRNGEFLRVALLYAQAFVTQISQTAVCNRLHSVDQQLCRWLLMCMDRLESNQINLTHEWIATMLGVRREGVTQAAGKLQAKGYIQYSRGKIRILDREAIEDEVCECYAVVNDEYERLLKRNFYMQMPKAYNLSASHMRLTHVNGNAKPAAKGLAAEQLVARKTTSSYSTYARAR